MSLPLTHENLNQLFDHWVCTSTAIEPAQVFTDYYRNGAVRTTHFTGANL